MTKAMSFQASRKEMLAEIQKKVPKSETKVIKFDNNGVPEFLKRLDEFEEKSKTSRFVVG